MRVRVYVDGYNLYYGARSQCRDDEHWKWIDVRQLVSSLITEQGMWNDAVIDHIVYCTARIDARLNPQGHFEQDIYLKALLAAGSVDHIEYGKYISSVRVRPLATRSSNRGGIPEIVHASWPVMVQAPLGTPRPEAVFMVSTLHQEEKGSDVNLATSLMRDVLTHDADAVVVVSNDSDLKLPVRIARDLVPVGLINPRADRVAGDLAGHPDEGVGSHWWRRLDKIDYLRSQLPQHIGTLRRPDLW